MGHHIIEMVNVSPMTIAVTLDNGHTVYLAPRVKMENVVVQNIEHLRKFCRVKEQLNDSPKPRVEVPPYRPNVSMAGLGVPDVAPSVGKVKKDLSEVVPEKKKSGKKKLNE